MVYTFTLPTTSPLSFQSFLSSQTHPSLPQSASTARHALRLALKAHKRLPGSRQEANLPTVLSALNEYIPYLFAISYGLSGRAVQSDSADRDGSIHSLHPGEEIDITLHTEIESSWKPTLSMGSLFGKVPLTSNSMATSSRPRGGRVSGRGIDFEIAFTLTTLGYVLSLLARIGAMESLYTSPVPTTEQRVASLQAATRHLLQASSVHSLLASSPSFTAATGSSVSDINATTQSALSSLALAEATLLAVLKDDSYVTACIQARNPNDKEWMVRAPEIPKVRALLFARLCVRAAEYAEQAAAGLGSVGSGRSGGVDEVVTQYAAVLGRVARARACRFFGIDAEIAGKAGEAIAWLQAARTSLGLRGVGLSNGPDETAGTSKSGFSRLRREWSDRREERKIGKHAGGGRDNGSAIEAGDDAGRDEEGRVLEMLETKWVRMNDTINTQLIPPSAPLLSNLPSGRDIHTPPAPYKPPSLDEEQLVRMRAPPDDRYDLQFANDPDDSEEESLQSPRTLPSRAQTASNVYY